MPIHYRADHVTLFDLMFLLCFVTAAVTLIRALYLLVRRRTARAGTVLKRLGVCAALYVLLLLVVSASQPTTVLAMRVPQCFDDWCIAVDSASRQPNIGGTNSAGAFVIVHGRVLNNARSAERETDVSAILLAGDGRRYSRSEAGQRALVERGGAGHALTDMVAPGSANQFSMVFDVPKDADSLAFVTTHGWFPGALIIGNSQSLFHRPSVVPLPTLLPSRLRGHEPP